MSKEEIPIEKRPGKSLLDQAKAKANKTIKNNNQKENKEMNSTWKTVITVAITLVSIAAFVVVFLYGMSFGASQEHNLNQRVQSEVKTLSAVTAEQPKK